MDVKRLVLLTRWATRLRAEELWEDVLSKELQLPRGTWVAVRYTGEYLTAKSEAKLRKSYDKKNWLTEAECPHIAQFGCPLELIQAKRAWMLSAIGQSDKRTGTTITADVRMRPNLAISVMAKCFC
jgi:hypothetical protein